MLVYHSFREKFRLVAPSIRPQNLVVLIQLDLVVIDCVCELLTVLNHVPIFNIMKLLEAIDSNRKDLPRRLQDT